ncbi:hypothetical protein E1A91_A04G091000v1 [Gossypium mustelinum]|uniref:HhH-GPD domain-containing protein n=1 Tax=Gossypium mustelinum TaxID=34275 RepID=A0A5D2ZMA0_GOSMU|nr:hypothetical protein E1A91_A04G091000v1 [Gossypium mustelinum]
MSKQGQERPVIHIELQENQIFGANCIESERCSFGFAKESQTEGVVACSDSGSCTEVNGSFSNLMAASVWSESFSCGQNPAELSNVSSVDLSAIATAVSAASTSAASVGINNHSGCGPSGLFPVHVNLSTQRNIRIAGNCTPRKNQNVIPPQNPYDYDFNLPAGPSEAFSQTSISDFAPITPDKARTAEMKEVPEIGKLYIVNITEKQDEQANELVPARLDVNVVQCSKGLQMPVLESSLTATPSKENQNSDNGGSHLAELEITTPQQKQRKRKHRPKVVTEGKPRRPRKPATPKPDGSQETPTGKRKYVRKSTVKNGTSILPGVANAEKSTGKRKYVRRKGLNKDSTIPTQEEGGKGATHPETLEHNKKPCRRALDFDTEGQEREESSACKPACNLNSSPGTENLGKEGSQSKSMVQLCGIIEVDAEKTQTGIAFELKQSVKEKLKDDLSLPEDQAPGTPVPTKNNPSHRRQNTHPQKLSNRRGKDKATGHDGLKRNEHTPLDSDAQLLARSLIDSKYRNSSLLEGGQANKSAATQQEDTRIVNSYGSHYNNFCAYQMILGMEFPHIHRRKRTGKGQNSATSSASSSITAARSLVPAEACLADKMEVNPHQLISSGVSTEHEAGRKFSLNKMQTFNYIMASNQTESSKKKRTRETTGIQDLASLNGIAQCKRHPEYCSSQPPVDYDMRKVGNTDRPQTSMEALVTEMQAKLAKTKQTKKRNCLVSSACSSTNEAQMHKKLLRASPEEIWKQFFSVDALLEQFNQLDINREGSAIACQEQNALAPYKMIYQEHNALVVYRDGTIVPFVPTRKRRPRPKVDLDEETNRVWKLLLENINSEGIDGTDEEKAKWWEEERRVFSGRADSFIARMHLVQGDRRFSPWKGSVLDSVIGVFLTQNVSDHLSSSAFMSLAARFPIKSKSKDKLYHQEGTSLVNGAEFYVLEPEESIKWDAKTAIQPVGDQSSMTVDGYQDSEEKEVANSEELSGSSTATVSSLNEPKCNLLNSSGSGLSTYCDSTANRPNMETIRGKTDCFKGDEETNDVLSSQNSVVSSENSGDFSLVQTAERTGSCSEGNSEGADHTKGPIFNILNGSTSFVQLLQMVGSARLHEVQSHQNMSPNENSNVRTSQFQNHQRENCDNSNGPKSFTREDLMPSANYHPYLTLNSEVRETGQFETLKEETRVSEASKTIDENMIKRLSPLTQESASQSMDQNDKTRSVQVTQQSSFENFQSSTNTIPVEMTVSHCPKGLLQDTINLVESPAEAQNKEMLRHVSKHSEETLDITESSTAFDNQRTPQQKMQESNLYTHDSSSNKELNSMVGELKSEGRKVKKEKKDDFDWDSLRKQTEVNGRKREKTEKTMDSLDWEAVRCAEVHEIAETIKERGMNNVLAQRIKDFLNRLVRDHGSIDLEWLRDVPPDKAKEYLLSIRGLGLKSVECVRLLTLHHLAFPVDTNVGRIAVRLGWVPLQPLPESLQLHLLELYPILESIQKYLWPRLCKLDQRTLYELHYQMITFGKVFCTKGKPNCNACPMRGECRHFASAFASARLALPGPEEKSIVSATENGTSDRNPAVIIDQLALPLPQPNELSDRNYQSEANQQLQAASTINKCDPIIEEPASPEPECTQVAENDIEDMFSEDPDEIPTIKLNMEEFTQTLQNYMQNNMELQEGDMSKALVALTAEAASIPTPRLKNVNRLRTEHQVYELPDSHPLLNELDKREPDDPCKYLLAIWTPGETANSIQQPERRCNSQEHGKLCDDETCFSCNSIREAESQIVRGTLLIPCRTAMRGSFPLNGTYFQVNEVFADHDSSLNPIAVPREWLWNLPRRMVYFGTSIPSIFKGLTTEGIQHCFWRGYVCVRGFDQKSRAPRPLMARLHFPASRLAKAKGKGAGEDE